MRILILANFDEGLYKFRGELLEKLARKNEVYFTVPDGKYIAKLEALGCKYIQDTVLSRHNINPFQELRLIAFYSNCIKSLKPNVVLTYTIKPNIYGGLVCRRNRIPYIVNITGLGIAVENDGIMQQITIPLYRMALRKAAIVFFQNVENRDFMIGHRMISGPSKLLPGSGVNLERYPAQPYPNGPIMDFIFVARIMKEKGIDQYLAAAKEIRKRHPETRFHVFGICEQDYENKLRMYQEEGTIIYHGAVSDMVPVYRMSCCTVHPTYYPEGMSNVLLESAASARPIITTNRPGCREIIDDGINGLVVKQRDSADLINKIERFLSLSTEERRQMGLAGRAKMEKEFDRRIVVESYRNEVEKLMDGGN